MIIEITSFSIISAAKFSHLDAPPQIDVFFPQRCLVHRSG